MKFTNKELDELKTWAHRYAMIVKVSDTYVEIRGQDDKENHIGIITLHDREDWKNGKAVHRNFEIGWASIGSVDGDTAQRFSLALGKAMGLMEMQEKRIK